MQANCQDGNGMVIFKMEIVVTLIKKGAAPFPLVAI